MSRHNAEDTTITCRLCGYKSDEYLTGDMTSHFAAKHPAEWALVEAAVAERTRTK